MRLSYANLTSIIDTTCCAFHNGFPCNIPELRTVDAESGSPESKRTESNTATQRTTSTSGRQLVHVDSFISDPRKFLLQLPVYVKILRIAFFPAIVLLVYVCIMISTANTLGSFEYINLDPEAAGKPLTVYVDSCDVLLQHDENQEAGIAIAVSTKSNFQANTTT